jgi:hypothetical protein
MTTMRVIVEGGRYKTEPCEDDDDEGHRGGRSAAKDSTL